MMMIQKFHLLLHLCTSSAGTHIELLIHGSKIVITPIFPWEAVGVPMEVLDTTRPLPDPPFLQEFSTFSIRYSYDFLQTGIPLN